MISDRLTELLYLQSDRETPDMVRARVLTHCPSGRSVMEVGGADAWRGAAAELSLRGAAHQLWDVLSWFEAVYGRRNS